MNLLESEKDKKTSTDEVKAKDPPGKTNLYIILLSYTSYMIIYNIAENKGYSPNVIHYSI